MTWRDFDSVTSRNSLAEVQGEQPSILVKCSLLEGVPLMGLNRGLPEHPSWCRRMEEKEKREFENLEAEVAKRWRISMTHEPSHEDKKDKDQTLAIWIAIGVGAGVALGAAMGNLASWIAVRAGIGVVIGALQARK